MPSRSGPQRQKSCNMNPRNTVGPGRIRINHTLPTILVMLVVVLSMAGRTLGQNNGGIDEIIHQYTTEHENSNLVYSSTEKTDGETDDEYTDDDEIISFSKLSTLFVPTFSPKTASPTRRTTNKPVAGDTGITNFDDDPGDDFPNNDIDTDYFYGYYGGTDDIDDYNDDFFSLYGGGILGILWNSLAALGRVFGATFRLLAIATRQTLILVILFYWPSNVPLPVPIPLPPVTSPTPVAPTPTLPLTRGLRYVQSGHDHTCIITGGRYRKVKCFGNNDVGQLGYGDFLTRGNNPGDMCDRLDTIDLGDSYEANSIALGHKFSCAILNRGVKCWGHNERGQLGLGDKINRGGRLSDMGNNLPYIDFGFSSVPIRIVTGHHHACALFEGSRVICWGANDKGQLGYGDTSDEDNPRDLSFLDLRGDGRITKIYAGGAHTCVVFDPNGRVKCWGDNDDGQLGYGDTSNRGNNDGEMGNDLDYVDLGDNLRVEFMSLGERSTCALLTNGGVKCWGANEVGQLGYGDTDRRGNNDDEMGEDLDFVDLGVTPLRLYSGDKHSCIITPNNSIKCFGNNDFGQLGLGDTSNRGNNDNEMGSDLPFVSVTQLEDRFAYRQITIGGDFTCVYLQEINSNPVRSFLKCFGLNNLGQLGLGDTNDRGDQFGEMGNNLPTVCLD